MSETRYGALKGKASDRVPEILAVGGARVSTLYLSLSERHPEGQDAAYLRWHTLDHRPEQFRIVGLQAALRVVSTPECRAARAAEEAPFAAADHAMAYFFSDPADLEPFGRLATALRDAGRSPFILKPASRGAFRIDYAHAAPRIKVGRDVLPWWPVVGAYLLLERGEGPVAELVDRPGVGGLYAATAFAHETADTPPGTRLYFLFLDEDPVEVAQALKPVLEARWLREGIRPLLAAPFYAVIPYQWDRYLP